MDIVSGIVLYLLIWWTVIFAVLPWGNKAPDDPEKGFAGSAPINPRIKLKFIVTTVVAAILWLIIYALISAEVINFYDYAQSMGT